MGSAVRRILDHLKDDGGLREGYRQHRRGISRHRVALVERQGDARPQDQTVIAELRYVVDRLADFYTPEETRLWLHAQHPMLGDARAIDLINSGRTEEVLAVIEALDTGAYT